MKKVLFILACFTFLVPLFAAELQVSKNQNDLTFISSYGFSSSITNSDNSMLELYDGDESGTSKKKAKKKKSGGGIDYSAFSPFKTPLLIGAISFTSITTILLATGIISGGLTGYYIQLGHYSDPDLGIEEVKLIGSAVYTGIAWSFLALIFLPISAVLWIGYAFARKGEKSKSTQALLSYKKVSFNPCEMSFSIKLD